LSLLTNLALKSTLSDIDIATSARFVWGICLVNLFHSFILSQSLFLSVW
jgi:hypothetical protein